MKLLALDTATDACSVALLHNEEIIEEFVMAPRLHAQLILPMIKKMLSAADLSLSQLDALAFAQGPGSFTGVRIAAGIVQGLAFAADLPVVPVSTLLALAQGALHDFKAEYVLAGLDARMQEIYWGIFQLGSLGVMEAVSELSVVAPVNAVIPEHNQWLGVGSAWDTYGELLKQQSGGRVVEFKLNQHPHARDVAIVAYSKFIQGQYVTAEQALPVYLREKVV